MTKNNENKRFANRETTIKGEVANFDTLEKQAFEIVVPYVRSNDKAEKAVRENLKLDKNWFIRINEIINEKPKPIKYNESKIYDYCDYEFANEKEANANCGENQQVVKIRWFEYECAFWAYEENTDSYITDYVHDNSPIGFTKADMRSFMAHSAQELIGNSYKILAVHNCVKTESVYYCVIDNEELAKCVIES